jgi:Asp/Glu/hydantoin racemase
MASMYIASALAEGFSLLVQLPEVIGIAKRQVHDLGLRDRCVGIYSVGIPVLELRKPESFWRLKEVAVASIEEGGADAVCFGCMAMNDHAPKLSDCTGGILSGSHRDPPW